MHLVSIEVRLAKSYQNGSTCMDNRSVNESVVHQALTITKMTFVIMSMSNVHELGIS